MRAFGLNRSLPGFLLAFLALLPSGVEGQLRTVVSSEIAVSETEATLRLDFEDGADLDISFQEGRILVDGEEVGRYNRRDALDLAWRSLLGDVITLDDGPLATRLMEWDPPEALAEEAASLGDVLDESLEEALTLPEFRQETLPSEEEGAGQEEEGLLTALFSRQGALSGLAQALEGASVDQFILKIGEDVEVEAGEEMEASLIVVDGDLAVRGRIDGDVVVARGTVRVFPEGRIAGDLRVADGELLMEGGSVVGSVVEVDSKGNVRAEGVDPEELRRELEKEIRRDLQSSMPPPERHRPNPLVGFFGNVGSAIAGLLENLVTFLVLAVLGVLAVHFQRERLEVVATTARRAPVRSAVVGLAGGFFLLPIWILGIIALAITIIGIPVLLAWIPLFPIVAGAAVLFGFLGVARNVGEWVAEQEYRGLEWIRGSNTFYTVVAGVGAFMVPCVAANAVRILGFGFFTGLLEFLGTMVTLVASAVGFGAVLLTRGGKIRPLVSYYDFEEEYWTDVGPEAPSPSPAPEPAEAEGTKEEAEESEEDVGEEGADAEGERRNDA